MFGQQEEPIRLEAFDTNIRGKRTLVVGNSELSIQRIFILESESLYKGKSILVYNTSQPPPQILKHKWDIVFKIKDSFDLQMLVTYVQNAPKPVRVLWYAPTEIPRQVWQRWQKADISLIGFTQEGGLAGCEWESILFPLKCEQGVIERVLGARGSGIANMARKLRDHLSEIASSGASLAWTNIEESDSRGGLYWFDPLEGVREDTFTKKEAVDVLMNLSKWIERSH